MTRPVHSIHNEDVGPAIVVVINKGHTRTHRFRQIFLTEGGIVMDKMDASLLRDVAKRHGVRRRVLRRLRARSHRARQQKERSPESPHWPSAVPSRPTPKASATRLM